MSSQDKHLYYLSELKDYKVNRKDPDIRGWEVRDLDNRCIGKVDNLIVNKELGKVVYIDVEVDQNIINIKHDPYAHSQHAQFSEFINKEGENHIIIPIGIIDIKTDNKLVFTESVNYETFAETKRYKSGTNISREYENEVLNSYDTKKSSQKSQGFNDQIKKGLHDKPDHKSSGELDFKDNNHDSIKDQITYENIRSLNNQKNDPATNSSTGLDHETHHVPSKTLDEDEEWVREKNNDVADSSEVEHGRKNHAD